MTVWKMSHSSKQGQSKIIPTKFILQGNDELTIAQKRGDCSCYRTSGQITTLAWGHFIEWTMSQMDNKQLGPVSPGFVSKFVIVEALINGLLLLKTFSLSNR